LIKSRGSNSLDGFTDFNFETIPDGLTPMDGDGDVTQDFVSRSETTSSPRFGNFLLDLMAL
jgi:hypothetical protein